MTAGGEFWNSERADAGSTSPLPSIGDTLWKQSGGNFLSHQMWFSGNTLWDVLTQCTFTEAVVWSHCHIIKVCRGAAHIDNKWFKMAFLHKQWHHRVKTNQPHDRFTRPIQVWRTHINGYLWRWMVPILFQSAGHKKQVDEVFKRNGLGRRRTKTPQDDLISEAVRSSLLAMKAAACEIGFIYFLFYHQHWWQAVVPVAFMIFWQLKQCRQNWFVWFFSQTVLLMRWNLNFFRWCC